MAYHKYGRNIPEFVKRFREEKGWSQTYLAQQLGRFHGQYVSNVERGQVKAPITFCARLMNLCHGDRQVYLRDLIERAQEDELLSKMHG
jgi:transcriptional regulator with XRE-family HTH domain